MVDVGSYLVNRRFANAPRKRNLWPHGWDEDDISGEKPRVLRLVAIEQQVVKVEIGDGLVVALQQDVTHGALGAGAPGGKERVDEGA